MDILESVEVRWFLPLNAPAVSALQQWFASISTESERHDHYLATGRGDLGFKARLESGKQAKVETKYLVGSLGIVDLAPGMSGDLQRWTKLSLALDDTALKDQGTWRDVKKTRQLRKFEVTLEPTIQAAEVPVSSRPPAGCGVELTKLEYIVDGLPREEWTFGLEAFGPAAQLLDVLQVTLREIARLPGLPEMRPEWTASYASWMLPSAHETAAAQAG